MIYFSDDIMALRDVYVFAAVSISQVEYFHEQNAQVFAGEEHTRDEVFDALVCKLVWDFLSLGDDGVSDAFIYDEKGQLIPLTYEAAAFETSKEFHRISSTNGYIDVVLGTVALGQHPEELWLKGKSPLNEAYKVFDGRPVFVKSTEEILARGFEIAGPSENAIVEARSLLTARKRWLSESMQLAFELPPKTSHAARQKMLTEAEDYILEMHNRSEAFTKSEMQRHFCAGKKMSVRLFQKAWAEAAKKQNELSKPGRKSN